MDQRLQFLSSYQKEEMSVTDLCHEYGISRPTAYKWIKRYDEVGPEGLLDLTRAPHGSPHTQRRQRSRTRFSHCGKRFPSWGARKLKARLERMNPNVSWPAASTVGQILSRAGLTNPRRKKRHTRRVRSRSRWSLRPISFGAWTSRDISSPVTAIAAIRLRSPTRTAGF